MAHPSPQRFVPYLAYADAPAALRFLEEAFGFALRFRHDAPDGRVGHAEVVYGDSVLMLASTWPEIGFTSQRELAARSAQVVVWVEDIDAHFARARAAGATVIAAPRDEPHGARTYRAHDPEGHAWIFTTPPRNPDEQENRP